MTAPLDVLFKPLRIGNVTLKNRLVMAPMTRNRSHLDGVPSALNVLHYQQRAGAGLIVTEGVYPSEMGKGYLFSPGLCTEAHAAGWQQVTEAVHEKGGAIFAQLMHVGRLSDPLMLNGAQPVGVSAVQPDPTARHYTVTCPRPKRPYPEPRALATAEVYAVIEDYRRSAALARKAGFDGVEIHAASGYLPMQFLSTNTNLRSDEFGGSLENRARFLLAIVDAIAADQGSAKCGAGPTGIVPAASPAATRRTSAAMCRPSSAASTRRPPTTPCPSCQPTWPNNGALAAAASASRTSVWA